MPQKKPDYALGFFVFRNPKRWEGRAFSRENGWKIPSNGDFMSVADSDQMAIAKK
ncbi:MAG: hypothetical protein ING66_07905 [Rhodocyclaceae bacterium]|jgi:hypothetical protein|nr:hypothetical protein [Rhodocyclaceae bacterium]MCA3035117.1 hypothetical protein [Rhodocyclaceae bacterium]MCA3061557.1 hypothetical protein [Rhodocyclaceae bacterium]MCA3082377.1 hypothetical protein [Rhodocyclaceae bacterium]